VVPDPFPRARTFELSVEEFSTASGGDVPCDGPEASPQFFVLPVARSLSFFHTTTSLVTLSPFLTLDSRVDPSRKWPLICSASISDAAAGIFPLATAGQAWPASNQRAWTLNQFGGVAERPQTDDSECPWEAQISRVRAPAATVCALRAAYRLRERGNELC